jgi:hypothetical protein
MGRQPNTMERVTGGDALLAMVTSLQKRKPLPHLFEYILCILYVFFKPSTLIYKIHIIHIKSFFTLEDFTLNIIKFTPVLSNDVSDVGLIEFFIVDFSLLL